MSTCKKQDARNAGVDSLVQKKLERLKKFYGEEAAVFVVDSDGSVLFQMDEGLDYALFIKGIEGLHKASVSLADALHERSCSTTSIFGESSALHVYYIEGKVFAISTPRTDPIDEEGVLEMRRTFDEIQILL